MGFSLSVLRRLQAIALGALIGLTVVACESGSSTTLTTPTTPTSPTTPTLPPATNLAGTWAGTTSVKWDAIDGGGGCSGPVTVTFAQSGSAVSATLPEVPGCFTGTPPAPSFEGTLSGDVLKGRIVFSTFSWTAFGQASEDHVTMTATNVTWDLRR